MPSASFKIVPATHCYHCGQKLQHNIVFDQKHFCCQGCKAVYELLQNNNLCDYYQLKEANAQTNPVNDAIAANQFSYLDREGVLTVLADYQDQEKTQISFSIPQMHCTACIYLLEHLQLLNAHILSSRVNFPDKRITVLYNHNHLQLSKLVSLLTKIGYEPVLTMENLDVHAKMQAPKLNKKLLYQMGVAGFCFGNTMLLSFPEYFTPQGMEAGMIKQAIDFLLVILSLPIVFFAATDYYKSAWFGLQQRILNIDLPIVLGIFALFTRSLYEIIYQTGPGYFDSLAGLLFFLLLGKFFQQKTYDHLSFERNYKSFFPVSVSKKVAQGYEQLPIDQIVKGDVIYVRNEEIVPGDSLLMADKALIDYSFVTGESHPVERFKGDVVYAGGRVVGQAIVAELIKLPSQSYLTQLWNHESFQKNAKTHQFQSITDVISKVFTPAVIFIAIMGFAVWSYLDFSKAFQVVAAVLIIACPCALALSAPFTFGNTIRLMGYRKFYLKNAGVVDKLSQVDTIIFDKTGTLTSRGEHQLDLRHLRIDSYELQLIKAVCMQSSHPLSQQLANALPGVVTHTTDLFDEIKGKGLVAHINGHDVRIGSAAWLANEKIQNQASTRVFVEIDEIPRGYVSFEHHYRQGLADTVAQLKKHYQLMVLSGDNSGEAETLKSFFGADTTMLFNQMPADKLAFVAKLAAEGRKVMMLGDGLNDAGALQASWVGVAITENSNFFSPASDAILAAESFSLLPPLMAFARKSRTVIWRNLALSITYNVVGLSFALMGALTPVVSAILMPVSSITVVAAATLQTRYLAKKLKIYNIWK